MVRSRLQARGGAASIASLGPVKPKPEDSPHQRSRSLYVRPRGEQTPPPNGLPPALGGSVERLHLTVPTMAAPPPVTVAPPPPAAEPSQPAPPAPSHSPRHTAELVGNDTSSSSAAAADDFQRGRGRDTMRLGSRSVSRSRPSAAGPGAQYRSAMNDHFDQYRRAPSRERSVDRFSRSARQTPQPERPQLPVEPPEPSASRRLTLPNLTEAEIGIALVPATPEEAAAALLPPPTSAVKRTESTLMPGPQARRDAMVSIARALVFTCSKLIEIVFTIKIDVNKIFGHGFSGFETAQWFFPRIHIGHISMIIAYIPRCFKLKINQAHLSPGKAKH